MPPKFTLRTARWYSIALCVSMPYTPGSPSLHLAASLMCVAFAAACDVVASGAVN